MGESDRKGVRGITGGCFRESQKCTDHECDLFFCRRSLANHGLFHSFRWIFVDREPLLSSGKDGYTPGRTQNDRGGITLDENDFFDRQGRRLVTFNRSLQRLMNGNKASFL